MPQSPLLRCVLSAFLLQCLLLAGPRPNSLLFKYKSGKGRRQKFQRRVQGLSIFFWPDLAAQHVNVEEGGQEREDVDACAYRSMAADLVSKLVAVPSSSYLRTDLSTTREHC